MKLLLLAVEGTTLLSNVFKSSYNDAADAPTRKISIRNLYQHPENESIHTQATPDFSEERNQMLADVQQKMDMEQSRIEEMRKIATADIEAMQAAWQEEKTALQQQAYEEAFQIGFSEGRDKALADMEASVQQANDITKKSKEIAENYQESQERVILELAMRVAERILNVTLEEDEEKFLSIVRRALLEVREMKEIKLYVSADYYELVASNRSELTAIFPPETPFLIFVNEDFEATECYIETNHGRIVVTIDEQLEEVRKRLVDVLEQGD